MNTDCAKSVGHVIYDCICLFLGEPKNSSSFTEDIGEQLAQAAVPVLPKIKEYIQTIASQASNKTEVATAVYLVVSTIYSGGCLHSVMKNWHDTNKTKLIIDSMSNDGLKEISVIMVEIATADWLFIDSINCVETCSHA